MHNRTTTLVGSHISIAGSLERCVQRGQSIGCTAMQIFTKSNHVWFDKPISPATAEKFKTALAQSSIASVIVHCGYLVNIGSKEPEKAQQSTKSLLEEVRRCEQLGLHYLVIHPGAHVGSGVAPCITQIAKNLDYVLEQSNGTVTILLETMAGQGTTIGRSFEELQSIRDQAQHKNNIGFCLDTCHILAAGYDITTDQGYEDMITQFDTIIGLEHLKAIHVNDSKTPFNSHKDRHAPLGEGTIPLSTFKRMMNDPRLVDVPKVLETPSDPEMHLWAKEIAMLKAMIA